MGVRNRDKEKEQQAGALRGSTCLCQLKVIEKPGVEAVG